MTEGNLEFWNEQLKNLNTSGLGYEKRLSATDLEVIRQRCEALRWREDHRRDYGLGSIDIKTDIAVFARKLGGSEEEIACDVLPSLGFIEKPNAPTDSRKGYSLRSIFSRFLRSQ